MMDLILGVGIPALLIVVALLAGTGARKRHTGDLDRREQRLRHLRVTDLRDLTNAVDTQSHPPVLVAEEITLAADYFIAFLAKLKHLVGGEVRVYSDLMLRARREAALRVMERAERDGYNAVANMRIDFADITGNAVNRRRAGTMVTILAAGTAYRTAGDDRTAAATRETAHGPAPS